MTTNDDLLAEINRFLEETGMGPTTFGVKAVMNAHLVGRLRRGRDIQMTTGKRVRAFMRGYRRLHKATKGSVTANDFVASALKAQS